MKTKMTLSLLVLISIFYVLWSSMGRVSEEIGSKPNLQVEEVRGIGIDSSKGNVVGIQPYMLTTDYQNQYSFYQKLEGYFEIAKDNGFFNEKTVVLLPEYLGTWLVVAGEKEEVYDAPTVAEGMQTLVLSNFFSFIKAYFTASEIEDKVRYAIFKMKAQRMASIYQQSFSTLAKKYGVSIVAGSIVLPSPSIENGNLVIGEGDLYNISLIFRPNGVPDTQIVKKIYPIDEELSFTKSCPPQSLPSFDLSMGKVGVLICADSWHSEMYETLKKQGVSLVLVPSYSSPMGIWATTWQGYNGTATPEDVNKHDIGKITEGQAWLKYALAGKLPISDVRNGFNVFLRGKLWDLGADGHSVIVKNGTLHEGKHVDSASIICLWL